MSRELDGLIRYGRYPRELQHFEVAERWHASPYEVLHLWPDEMVIDAQQIMSAEGPRQLA